MLKQPFNTLWKCYCMDCLTSIILAILSIVISLSCIIIASCITHSTHSQHVSNHNNHLTEIRTGERERESRVSSSLCS